MRIVAFIVLFLLIGLVVGYIIFGQINNEYVNPVQFISKNSGLFDLVKDRMFGLEEKRNKILVSGAIGGVIGLFFGVFVKK